MSIIKYRDNESSPWQTIDVMKGRDAIHVGPSAPTDPEIDMWLDTDEPGQTVVTSVNGMSGPVTLDATDVGGISMKLLWTNQNPSSAFAAQTISVDLSAFDIYKIYYRQLNTVDVLNVIDAPVGHGASVGTLAGYSSLIASREARVENGGLVISDCYSSGQTTNQYCVPVYIYGIKGVLPL